MRYVLALFLAFALQSVSAATLIESQGTQGAQKMWIEGTHARVEAASTHAPGYVLIDLRNKSLQFVNDVDKTVMDMSSRFSDEPPAKVNGAQLVKVGAGPKIAGYRTVHYQIRAGGKVCRDTFVSKEILQEANLREFAQAAAKVYSSPTATLASDVCGRAEASLQQQVVATGFPLRSTVDGQVQGEVKSVKTNAKLPPQGFRLPKGYRRIDIAEYRREMQQRAQQGHGPQAPQSGTP